MYMQFIQSVGYRLLSTFHFLKEYKSFFIDSNYRLVCNIHADSGLGTYILDKEVSKIFLVTDDHNLMYKNMRAYYKAVENAPINEINVTSPKIKKTKWYLLWDNKLDRAVGLVSEYDTRIVCGYDDVYEVGYEFERERNAKLYFHDVMKPNYQKIITGYFRNKIIRETKECLRARYSSIRVSLKDSIELLK